MIQLHHVLFGIRKCTTAMCQPDKEVADEAAAAAAAVAFVRYSFTLFKNASLSDADK